ncbi:OX-2 membrane glycoprotein isoform X2 [Amia ocellicauda]|uniref:OX-2 membrane glycoprotein isoform X2 n=1 Tax=Amia ocellicauda TaxID=2972642 RepID=UPI0034640858
MDCIILFFIGMVCILSKGCLSANVVATGDSKVALNGTASFSCTLPEADGVLQVTWQKMYADKSIESVATYSKRFGAKVLSPYQDRINFTKSDLNTSSITIQNVRFEDAAIYICSFNAYPEGSTRGQLSLSVYGISEVTAVTHHVPSVGTSSQKVVVICAATGLPAPQVKWSSTAGAVLTGQERVQRVNGIYTVTSNLTVDTSELADKYVDCVVSNSDLKEPISQRVSLEQMARTTPEPTEPSSKDSSFSIMAVSIGVVILVTVAICLLLWIKKKHRGGIWKQKLNPEEDMIIHENICNA